MNASQTDRPEPGGTNPALKPAAIIYTHSLLEGSMTFIKSHAEALDRFTPVYAGSHRVDGIELPPDRAFAANTGSITGLVREAAFRKLGWAPALVKQLASLNPHIVHAHFGDCGPAAMRLADALHIPFVVTFHGQDATRTDEESMKTHRGRELIRLKSRMIDRAGAFIAVSDYIRQKMLNNGYPDDKIVVHRNGINLETFSSIEQRQREPVVLFIGRFVEKKGIPFLLRAAAALQSRGTGFRLVLIGGGPMEEDLKTQAEATGIPCEFIGFVDGAKVREWLARASTLAVPSVVASNGDSEGLPTVLLEAQAMKTPVVATRHSGIPEGMVEGVTGELVDEKDWEALADRLQSFLESPGKVAQFGDAGRKFVTENFRIEDQVRGLEDIYSDVIARRS